MQKDSRPPVLAPSNGPVAVREFDYYDLEPERRTPFKDYLHILRKRKWWVIWTFLGVVALTGLLILVMTPIYKSTTVLQITRDNPGGQIIKADPMSLVPGGQDTSKFQETQYKILTSRAVAARVIDALKLQDTPEFQALKEKDPTAPAEKLKSEMIDLFQDKLVVTPIKDTYLVEVAFKSQDRELAKKVIDALAREYMLLAIDSRSQSFTLVNHWLEKQLHQLAGKVQASQKKLFKFGQKHDFYSLEDKDNVIIQKYIEMSALLTKAQSERMSKEAQYRQIKEKGPDAPLITNNPLIMNLRQELVAQTAKVSGLNRTFLPGHPEMQEERAKMTELRGRLGSEVQRLQTSIKADYEAAVKAENLLTQAFEGQKDRLAQLQDNLVDFQILKRDAQTTEKLYQALLVRMGETAVASTMVASNVAVIDPPETPFEPYLPKPFLFLMLSGVTGLFLGVGAAFLVEYLDTSIKTTEDMERVVQLPSLGVVPLFQKDSRDGKNGNLPASVSGVRGLLARLKKRNGQSILPGDLDMVMIKHPRSVMAESIRHLRTSLMLSISGGPPAVIVVTSPHPGEGKSTIAVNLATALAQDGRRVVLLDCDLRRPRLNSVFRVTSTPGLTSYLTGAATKEDILKPTEVDNLVFIPAGPVPPSPTELLNSQAFKNMLLELRQDFHHLIIDTPPTLGFADSRVVSVQADGVLLVVKHQSTTREAGRQTRLLFSQVHARILGMILNQANVGGMGWFDHCNQKYYDNYYTPDQDEWDQPQHRSELPPAQMQ